MKTYTKGILIRDAIMVGITLAMIPWAAKAQIDVTASLADSQSDDAKRGYEVKAAINRGQWSLWASYGAHDQVIVTQSAGDLSIIGAGIGYETDISNRVTLYMDAGLASIDASYSDRIIREATWFSFQPTFGRAHWQPDDNYLNPDIITESDFEHGALVRLGGQFEITERLSLDVSYRFLHADQYMAIKNPTLAAEAGWWEGTFDRNLSSLNVGFNWEF